MRNSRGQQTSKGSKEVSLEGIKDLNHNLDKNNWIWKRTIEFKLSYKNGMNIVLRVKFFFPFWVSIKSLVT